jgi:hypothetical protein
MGARYLPSCATACANEACTSPVWRTVVVAVAAVNLIACAIWHLLVCDAVPVQNFSRCQSSWIMQCRCYASNPSDHGTLCDPSGDQLCVDAWAWCIDTVDEGRT